LSPLAFAERPAAGEPRGLLILHHGRGTSEQDLLPLADALDPQRQLSVFAPRAPLTLAGSPGFHWYLVPRVGYPDRESFEDAYRLLGEFHDELWRRTGIGSERTILGGFSMGAVMSYALGLGRQRPLPRGILAFSGFLATVESWQPELDTRAGLPVFIAHGTHDPVIDVEFGRDAAERLRAGGLQVEYHESPVAHQIDPPTLSAAATWVASTLAPGGAAAA
jgi:phospholipase/carboxylesterase